MSRVRSTTLFVLVALVACGQLWALVELVGLPLPKPALVLGMEGAVVLSALALGLKAGGSEARGLARWAAIGLGTWAFWGAMYFGAARMTDPPHARTFDDALLARLPLVPAFAAIYMGVHVFSIVPYCVLREERLLRRYLLGNVLIVLLSSVFWVALPVRLDRPPLPEGPPGFGMWLLRGVYAFDPMTNCFPSAHCSVAVYAATGLRHGTRPLFVWGIVSAALVCLSTVMTRQHYVADVAGGAVLAAIMYAAIARKA